MNDLSGGPRRELWGISQHHTGDTLTLALTGDVVADAGPPILDLLKAWLGGRLRHVVIDLAGVDFVDVAGLRVLLRARRACAEHQVTLTVRHPPPYVLWLLTVTNTASPLLEGSGPGAKGSRVAGARAEQRHRRTSEREEKVGDRELLADERDRLLDERQEQLRAEQDWQDIREDLADERELDLEHRERHDPTS